MDDFEQGDSQLAEVLRGRIEEAGSISFAEFMELALYHPRHGYYLRCDPTRDYQSSPAVHPVFGACIGRQVADFWRLLDRPEPFDVLEAGAGSGSLARDILAYLRRAEPDLYSAVRYVAQDRAYSGVSGDEKLSFHQSLPAPGSVSGCILSNELLDALPFHRVRVRDGRLLEVRVGLRAGRLADVEVEAAAPLREYFERLGLLPGEGCDAEVNLQAPAWLRAAAACLRRGYLLTLDYGYEAEALYAPWRRRGTLLTFYRHTSGEDPYQRLGKQDITASVDFTTLQRAGEEAGLRTLGLVRQAELLAALGVSEALSTVPDSSRLEAYYGLRRAVLELTDTSGLGRIQALIMGKDVPDHPLPLGLRPARKSGGTPDRLD